jgi:hypothetical protein
LHCAFSEETTTTMVTDEENTNQNTMTTAKRIMILWSISTMQMELKDHYYTAVAVHPNHTSDEEKDQEQHGRNDDTQRLKAVTCYFSDKSSGRYSK